MLALVLLLVFVPDWASAPRLALLGRKPRFTITPIALDPAHLSRRRVGQLTWIGGVQLKSDDPAFGGFSSLSVAQGRITLLSDGGNIVRFGLGGGRIIAPAFAELPAGPGTGWEKRDRDSESMAVDPASGTIWVGFENTNAIWRYTAGFGRATGHVRPRAMRHWSVNGGPESLVRMPDGGFVTMSETDGWPHMAGRASIRFAGDPVRAPEASFRFIYLPPDGYDVSDAAALPNGDLLVLNRAWSPPLVFATKLVRIAAASIRPGAAVRGEEIATLATPLIHENFEGLAVTRERNRTILWIVSDDNQSMFQRSLLTKFRLGD